MKSFSSYDSVDCGPTCLRMVAHHFGKKYSISYLRKLSYLNKQGVSLYHLAKAADTIGFKTDLGKLNLKYLTDEATLPCILFWGNNHFVVLYKIKKRIESGNDKTTYFIVDPSKGKLRLREDIFKKYWLGEEAKGLGLFLETTPQFFDQEEETKENKVRTYQTVLRFLFHYFTEFKRHYLQVFVAMALTVFISLVMPFLTQGIVDFGIQNKDIDFIVLILTFQLFLFLSSTITEIIRSHLMLHISSRINISILGDFLAKMMRLSISFFESKLSGDIIERLNDHQRVERFITATLMTTLFSIVKLLVFSSILLYYNTYIFSIYILGSVLSVAWTLIFMDRRRSLDYIRFRELSNTSSKLFEMALNMPEIKIHGFENYKQSEWQGIQVKLFKISISGLTLEQYQKIGTDFFNKTRDIVIMFLAAISVINGELTLGMMLAISYILGQLNIPISQIISFIRTSQNTIIGMERMNEVYNEPNEEPNNLMSLDNPKFVMQQSGISCQGLSFGYDNENLLFKNLNVEIPHNRVTAIVGESGSGKTTFLKLLLKFYQPSKGQISANNINLEELSTSDWRMNCGVVMQEGHIFSDSIARNIAMGESLVDNTKLAEVIDTVNMTDFITNLPLHVNTIIGESGNGLSTGQKQRILLARALYKNPSYLFLDEATSSLDATNEKIIVDNLRSYYREKTVVIIAHRLSTVKDADNIIVLSKGKVVESGSHRELVEKKGHYLELVKNQLELGT